MALAKALESQNEYTVGYIVALRIELAAVRMMLDEEHDTPRDFKNSSSDQNSYTWGRVGEHNVVIAPLPEGRYGTTPASTTAAQMLSSLPQIRFGLLVGIGGGIWSESCDIRLGDVAVSVPNGKCGGVIQYDSGKLHPESGKEREFERKGSLNAPPELLLKALAALGSHYEMGRSRMMDFIQDALNRHPDSNRGYNRPGAKHDRLFKAWYHHRSGTTCSRCDLKKVQKRSRRRSDRPQVHYGTIASGNTLLKDAQSRDNLVKDLKEEGSCICFEMEAAGLMNNFPCLVIRGISDYADSHKNDQWQRYAALSAAAFAKELLVYISSAEVCRATKAKDIMSEIHSTVSQIANTVNQEPQRERERRVNKLIEKLYTCPYAERKNRNKERVEGTCNWFTSHVLFRKWLDNGSAKLLWVSADPGCGKSVLARYLIDEVLPGHGSICYFYFKDDFPDQRNSANAVCSMLRQLILLAPNLVEDQILQQFERDGQRFTQSFSELWGIFVSTAAKHPTGNVFCVLDALDECQDCDRDPLIEAIIKESSPKSKLKFLLTSRPYDCIKYCFRELEIRLPTIHLSGEDEMEVEKISQEIDLVIQYRVQKIGRKKDLLSDEVIFLQQQLTSTPHRTYLWVDLTLDIIQRTPGFTRGEIRRVIREIPGTVDEAYEKILNRSSSKRRAKKLLHIIIAAKWPLSIEETSIALAVEENHNSYKDLEEELEPTDRFQNTARELCGLFIVIIDSKIYLLHQTAKEFLLQSDTGLSAKPAYLNAADARPVGTNARNPTKQMEWKHSLHPAISNRVLAESCVWYLKLNDLKSLRQSFSAYSAKNWFSHFREADINCSDEITKQALEICSPGSKKYQFWTIICASDKYVLPQNPTSLIASCYFGVEGIARLLLATGAQVDATDKDGKTPLVWAAVCGHKPVVKLLLESKAQVDRMDNDGRTPLSWAAVCGHQAVAELLLNDGAKIESKDKDGATALTMVCSQIKPIINPFSKKARGDPAKMIQFLVDRKANLDSRDDRGRTPLHHTADHGCKESAQCLLDGIMLDVNARDFGGMTPLHLAIIASREEVVQLLLNNADVKTESQSNEGHNPLHVAAKLGRLSISRLLLSKGASLHPKDNAGRTPLHLAATSSHATSDLQRFNELLELFLRSGASFGARDKKGQTALELAEAENSQLAITLKLWQRGKRDISNLIAQGIALIKSERELRLPDPNFPFVPVVQMGDEFTRVSLIDKVTNEVVFRL